MKTEETGSYLGDLLTIAIVVLAVIAFFFILIASGPLSRDRWIEAKGNLEESGFSIISADVQGGINCSATIIASDKSNEKFLIKMSGDSFTIKSITPICSSSFSSQ